MPGMLISSFTSARQDDIGCAAVLCEMSFCAMLRSRVRLAADSPAPSLHQQGGLEAARRNAIAPSAQFSDQSIR